jgi:hypothetical protein
LYQAVIPLPSRLLLVQIKKELTISGMDVDKMSIKETLWLFYNRIFTPDGTAPEILRKIL